MQAQHALALSFFLMSNKVNIIVCHVAAIFVELFVAADIVIRIVILVQ